MMATSAFKELKLSFRCHQRPLKHNLANLIDLQKMFDKCGLLLVESRDLFLVSNSQVLIGSMSKKESIPRSHLI